MTPAMSLSRSQRLTWTTSGASAGGGGPSSDEPAVACGADAARRCRRVAGSRPAARPEPV